MAEGLGIGGCGGGGGDELDIAFAVEARVLEPLVIGLPVRGGDVLLDDFDAAVDSFVLRAALQAAEAQPAAKPKRSREEIMAILKAAREAVQEANPTNRDLLAELIAERRQAATRGE